MSEALQNLRQSWREATAPLHQRWVMLQPREQRALAVAGAFTAVLVLVYGLWLPSRAAAQKAQVRYETQRALLLQLQGQGGVATGAPVTGGSVLRVASDAAGASNLALSRIEPEGEGRVRVWLEKADFNAVAGWLAALSAQGIRLEEAQVEKQADGGVSARFALSR
ncbi:MAG: epsM [Moraxellaceae bacterium]|jgi:general secretion pathway protein M|nr:epsM [Moraxellaceae bacterium]